MLIECSCFHVVRVLQRFMDVPPLDVPQDVSPICWMFRHLDISPSGYFAHSRDVSPPLNLHVCNVRINSSTDFLSLTRSVIPHLRNGLAERIEYDYCNKMRSPCDETWTRCRGVEIQSSVMNFDI